MTAFGVIPAALNALYADRNIGEDALYEAVLPLDGIASKPVRVVMDRAEVEFNAVGMAVVASSRVLNVRQSDAAQLQAGDQFTLLGGLAAEGGTILEVVGAPEFDGVSGEWTAQVREITLDRMDP